MSPCCFVSLLAPAAYLQFTVAKGMRKAIRGRASSSLLSEDRIKAHWVVKSQGGPLLGPISPVALLRLHISRAGAIEPCA